MEYIQISWHSTDVDVSSPDEKSIMTYVAQFLPYFKSLPVAEDRMQVQYVTPKALEHVLYFFLHPIFTILSMKIHAVINFID